MEEEKEKKKCHVLMSLFEECREQQWWRWRVWLETHFNMHYWKSDSIPIAGIHRKDFLLGFQTATRSNSFYTFSCSLVWHQPGHSSRGYRSLEQIWQTLWALWLSPPTCTGSSGRSALLDPFQAVHVQSQPSLPPVSALPDAESPCRGLQRAGMQKKKNIKMTKKTIFVPFYIFYTISPLTSVNVVLFHRSLMMSELRIT